MILFSSPLPLRTSAAWPGYREAIVLAHRYGATSGSLTQYDAARRLFVWADHPCQAVDAVTVDEQAAGDWHWYNGVDSTGRAVCFVEFATPPPEGAILRASGRGKLSSQHGGLIVNPADVVFDVLTNIAGKSAASLDLFRRECQRADLTVAGSLDSNAVTVQAAVREICASVGAKFAPDALGLAFLQPGGSAVPSLETIDRRFDVTAGAALNDLFNDLTVRFDYEDGEPRQAVQLEAPASVAKYGRRVRVMDARWLVSGRIAVSVGTRLLHHAARPVWTVEADNLRRRLRIGEGVTLDHGRLPLTGTFRVLARSVNPETDRGSIRFEVPAGVAPSVSLIQQSARIGPQSFAGIDVDTLAGERVLTLTEENGAPISGATVTLNGQTPRSTDGAGRVSFPAYLMPPGEHTLSILTRDGRTLTTKVTVQ